jgi:hypothetical protein
MTQLPRAPLRGICQIVCLILVWLLPYSCRDSLDLDTTVYECDEETPCAQGWLCAAGECHIEGRVEVSLFGAPAAHYPALFPFGGCDHLRLCYISGKQGAPQGCQEYPWTLNDPGSEVDFPAPRDGSFRITAQCMAGPKVVSSARSCPISIDESPTALKLYMMPPRSLGPTVDLSGSVTQLHTPRLGASIAELTDGRVLIAGGTAEEGSLPLATAELYDPRNGEFHQLTGPDRQLLLARSNARAVTLKDGMVAIFGGVDEKGTIISTVELFDPATGEFTEGPAMSSPRVFHTATSLGTSGKVMLAGGLGEAAQTYEIWSPQLGGEYQDSLAESRWHHTATNLSATDDGGSWSIAIAGGMFAHDGSSEIRSTMEFVSSGSRNETGLIPLCPNANSSDAPPSQMALHQALHVQDAKLVLAVGGVTQIAPSAASSGSCLWFTEPSAWAGNSEVFAMIAPRARFAAALAHGIDSECVLVAGGIGPGAEPESAGSAERFRLQGTAGSSLLIGSELISTPLLVPRWDHDAVTTCDGRVLIVGGLTGASVAEASVTAVTEVYNP